MKFEEFKMNPEWEDWMKNMFHSFYTEIWDDHEYDRFGIEISKGDVVVDLGASIGLFSQYAVSKGASKVFAFECMDERFELIKENISNTDKITPMYGFISDNDNGDNYNLERIFKDCNVEHIDFMKVDVDGYEYPFILNAPDELFKKVDKWAMEVHIWGMFDNRADEYIKMMQIIEKFSKNGYKVACEHVHKNTNLYMLYASK